MTVKKRSCGEGHIVKLKSGSWRGQLMDGYTDEGKRRMVSFTAPTRSEVLEQIRSYQNNQDNHIHVNQTLSFGSWADTWYADYRSQVQPSTYSGYQYTLKLLKKALGHEKVADVLPIHINRFQDQLVSQGYSLSQIRKCRAMLVQIFRSAEDNGLIGRNPAQRSKKVTGKDGKLNGPKRMKDSFTDEEVTALLEQLPRDLTGNNIRLLLGTGVRVQELLALSPQDIAEDGSAITVSKAIKMVDGLPTLGCPKSKQSYRTIPVPQDYQPYALYLRNYGGKELIWSRPGANPYYGVGCFRKRFYTAIGHVDGVRKLSPHCCRHTYITHLQARGVSIDLIARLAGHSEITTTDGYIHTSQATLTDAVSVLNSQQSAG